MSASVMGLLRRSSVAALLPAALLAACESPTGVVTEPVTAVIDLGGDDGPRLTVPSSVRAGEPFEVSFYTYHGGCHRRGPTDVRVRDVRADLHPYTLRTVHAASRNGARLNCPDHLALIHRTVTVELSRPGQGVVVLHGMRGDERIAVTATLEVLPK